MTLNRHFHALAIDGVFAHDDRGCASFRPLPPLEDAEAARVIRRGARRVERLLIGRGADADQAQADTLPVEQPLLAEIAEASVQGRAVEGPRTGKVLEQRRDQIDPHTLDDQARHRELPSLCTALSGYDVHAAVCVPARDRRRPLVPGFRAALAGQSD